jgi:large subunit ribosomal protein L25
MSELDNIIIEKRSVTNSRTSKKLRKNGYLPGNVYGKGIEPMSIFLKEKELNKSLSEYGRNHLFKLILEGNEKYTVIVKDVQNSPVQGLPIHIDFQRISLTEEINAEVGIKVVGKESLESRRLLLIRQIDVIPVRGLPSDIPDEIEINVAELNAGDSVNVGSVSLPAGIILEIEADQTILSVNDAVSEEEETDEESEAEAETETKAETE